VPKKRKPSPPLVPLTGKHKSYLRSLAHKLKAVVQIGHQGVTEGVVSALEVALERHELIKVKVAGDAEVDANEIGPQIEKATKSQVAQIIGHTLVIYRRRAENPKIVLPRVKPKVAASAKVAAAPAQDAEGDDDDDLDDEDDLDNDEGEDEDE
jgi:RNA-binding protein